VAKFEVGNTIGEATRFQAGQSGNPGGRPKGLDALFHEVLAEVDGDQTKGEALVRKLFTTAVSGNLQAMKLVLDRVWPAPNRHEISGSINAETLQQQLKDAARELDERLGINRDPKPWENN